MEFSSGQLIRPDRPPLSQLSTGVTNSTKEAIEADAGLLIVESDVIVKKNTLQSLYNGALQQKQCGIAAAVTTDEKGVINYPYLHAKGHENQVYPEKSIAASAVHYSPPDC